MNEKKVEWNPEKNENVISIVRQEDGNYIGYMMKWGKLVEVRQISPQVVLQLLLTDSGR